MSDMVIIIWFFEIIAFIVKRNVSQHFIDWQIRFFNRMVRSFDHYSVVYPYALRMSDELSACNRRRSSRWEYNISNIDEVCTQYRMNGSTSVLNNAWNMFCSGAYKIGGSERYADPRTG